MLKLGLILLAAALPVLGGSRRHTVMVSKFQFAPSPLRASIGDTIVWENQDLVPHTARADDGTWDSGDIPAKARRVVVLREKGEQTYTCLYHSNMKGKLIVR